MMPNCNYKGCHKAAEVVLGKINTKDEKMREGHTQ